MPTIRCDVVDVYIFRRAARGVEFLQLLRAEEPLKSTWHPIMGHVHEGETAVQTAKREMLEEVGLESSLALGMWALEQTHPFFVARLDCICLSPRFVVEVGPQWTPVLNEEHSEWRWVPAADTSAFVWPGQRAAVREVLDHIIAGGTVMPPLVRVG